MRKLLPLALLAALSACYGRESREASPGISLLRDFSIAETDKGFSRWRLDSVTARMDEKAGRIYFTAPLVKFYDGDKVSSEVASRAGTLQMREKAAELTGDVVVNAKKDGMRLETTKLFYSSARGRIWTGEPVTIYKDRTVIKGRGFTANPDLSEIEIEHQETRMAGK